LKLLADTLIEMYCQHKIAPAFATNLAAILKDMMKTQFLLHHILEHAHEKLLPTCFERCKEHCFVKSTDAFFFLDHMLRTDPGIGSAWLQRNFDAFFAPYMALLHCEQYTTKRQSIRLLCDILEKREFKPVMYKFVSCKARLKDARVHFKNTHETVRAIAGMNMKKAVKYLEDVIEHKRCIPFRKFNGGIGRTQQAKEFKTSQGRWPVKSCKVVIGLLKNCESNSEMKGLDSDNLMITHIQANRAKKGHRRTYRAHGRMGPYMNSPAHIEIIAEEKAENVDKPESKAVSFTKKRLQKKPLRIGGGV